MTDEIDRSQKHLSERLWELWERRKLFCFVFLAVFLGLATRALFQPAVYRSHALIQIEEGDTGGILGELKALEGRSNTDTELEIMRSFRVAEAAYKQLEAKAFLLEEHAHRPFEVLVRRLTGGARPCELAVETAPLLDGEEAEDFAFEFVEADSGACTLRAERIRADNVTVERVPDVRPGAEVSLFGRSFRFGVKGPVDGRRFVFSLRSPQDGARWIKKHIRVEEVGRRTGIVRLEFSAQTPVLARKIAAALADSYLALKRAQRREKVLSALEFLQSETKRVQERLRESEASLDRYRAESGALLLSERAHWLVEKTSALELERAQQLLLLEETRALRKLVEEPEGLAVALQTVDARAVDPITRTLSEHMVRLELSREALVKRGVLPDHPQRQQIEAEIASARDRLRSNLSRGIDRRADQVSLEIKHLDKTLAAFEEEGRKLPETERALAKFMRDAQADLKIHGFLVEKQQEARVALASTLASARLIDRPLEAFERSSPLLALQALVALLIASFLAVAAVAFAEYMDRTVKSASELEKGAHLSLFASIPSFRSVPGTALKGMKGALVTRERPTSAPAEGYRALRTNLRFARMEQPARALAITSATPGEGKTVTISNLAVACATLGERTVLIDADLHRAALRQHFPGPEGLGLADVLAGRCEWRESSRSTDVDGLTVIHAESKGDDAGALLSSNRLKALLDELREEYDWVLIDTPPVLAVADTASLLPHVDGALLVVRYKTHPLGVVLETRERILRLGANLMGVVFNGVDARHASRRKYGGYGGYYSAPNETEKPQPATAEIDA